MVTILPFFSPSREDFGSEDGGRKDLDVGSRCLAWFSDLGRREIRGNLRLKKKPRGWEISVIERGYFFVFVYGPVGEEVILRSFRCVVEEWFWVSRRKKRKFCVKEDRRVSITRVIVFFSTFHVFILKVWRFPRIWIWTSRGPFISEITAIHGASDKIHWGFRFVTLIKIFASLSRMKGEIAGHFRHKLMYNENVLICIVRVIISHNLVGINLHTATCYKVNFACNWTVWINRCSYGQKIVVSARNYGNSLLAQTPHHKINTTA